MLFQLRDENTNRGYGFTIDMTSEDFDEFVYNCSESWGMAKIETDYGVQDAEGGDGFIGFTSYEIKPEDYPKVLTIYRITFEDAGYTLGKSKEWLCDEDTGKPKL